MSLIALSILVYSIILGWHLLLNRGYALPTTSLPIRIVICICVIALATFASMEFLALICIVEYPLSEPIWTNFTLLHSVAVLWLEMLSALIACFLVLAKGRDVGVILRQKTF